MHLNDGSYMTYNLSRARPHVPIHFGLDSMFYDKFMR